MNLHAVKNKLLFNTLTAADVGAFKDSVDGIKYLFFKDSRHGTGLSIPFTADTQVVATTGQSAVEGLYVININQYARLCQDCDHEWVLTSRQEERVPGRNNSERTPKFIPYSMGIPAPQITSGVYSTTDQAAVRSELVNLIAAHTGKYGSPFYASKAWKFINVGGGNIALVSNGLGISIAGNGSTAAERIAALIVAANATTNVRVVQDPDTATTIYVIPIGDLNGTLTGTWDTKTNLTEVSDATGAYFIGLAAKSTDTAAYVEVRSDEMLTIVAKQTPQFATLTSNDVFEQFMLDPNDGNLAQFRRQLIPNDVAFTRYYFKWKQPKGVPSTSEGASFFNELWREAYVYMPTSVATDATSKWEAADLMLESGDSGFSGPDSSWADLLTWWQNDSPKGEIEPAITTGTATFAGTAAADEYINVIVNGVNFPIFLADTTTDTAAATALAAVINAHADFVAAVDGTTPEQVNISLASGASVTSLSYTGALSTQTLTVAIV